MGQVICKRLPLDVQVLKHQTSMVSRSLSGEAIQGVPYPISVALGLIVRQSEVQRASLNKAEKEWLDQFKPLCHLNVGDLPDDYRQIVVQGSVCTPQMRDATKVQEVIEAIFYPDTPSDTVISSFRSALNSGEAILVAVFSPRGGIPEDVYETATWILMGPNGTDKVFNQSRQYTLEDFPLSRPFDFNRP